MSKNIPEKQIYKTISYYREYREKRPSGVYWNTKAEHIKTTDILINEVISTGFTYRIHQKDHSFPYILIKRRCKYFLFSKCNNHWYYVYPRALSTYIANTLPKEIIEQHLFEFLK